MVGTIEVACAHDVRDILPGDRVEQQTAEERLLGFYGMRRSANLLKRAGFATRLSGSGHFNLA
jgi:hypothetical protein